MCFWLFDIVISLLLPVSNDCGLHHPLHSHSVFTSSLFLLLCIRSTCGEDQEAVQAQKIWKKAIMLVWRAAANHRWRFLECLNFNNKSQCLFTEILEENFHAAVHYNYTIQDIFKKIAKSWECCASSTISPPLKSLDMRPVFYVFSIY